MFKISRVASLMGFVLTAAALIGNAALTTANISGLMQANRLLDRSGDLVNELEIARSLLRDAESSRRGHRLTGDSSELTRFESAANQLSLCLNRLAGLTTDDPAQMKRVAELHHAVDVRLEALRRLGTDRSMSDGDMVANRRAMEEAERRMTEVLDSADDTIDARVAARDTAVARASFELATATVLALALLTTAWLVSRRELTVRQRSIEAERAAREAAQAANRAKDRMLAVVGHELRTPLTPVLMEVTSLLSQDEHPGLRPALEAIQSHIELEVRLVDDLIDLALLEQSRLRLERRPVDVHDVIYRAAEVCHWAGCAERPRLELDLAANRHYVEGDATRLKQILWNLLRNAADHATVGGTVTVRTHNEPAKGDELGTLIIEVADDGAGIAASDMVRIFDAFERGGTAGRPGGLGLGLAIARQLVEAHGGRITADSAGPGQGATFILQLPASECILHGVYARSVKEVSSEVGVLRVLLVEDHAASREAIATAIRRKGHQVRAVGRVAEAVAVAAGCDFDLLLSDLELPDGSGLGLMAALAGRGTPGIALSGFATEEDRRLSLDAGFAEHLAKPVTLDALDAALRRVAFGTTSARSIAVLSA